MERELKQYIQVEPTKMVTYLQLAKLQEDRKAVADAEATLQALRRALPNDTDAVMVLAAVLLSLLARAIAGIYPSWRICSLP